MRNRDLEPRRKEVPFIRAGVAHVAIARENNDGEAISYVYVLTAAENEQMKNSAHWIYPSIILAGSDTDELCFGELDVLDGYINEASDHQLAEYWRIRDDAWAKACVEVDKQAQLLADENISADVRASPAAMALRDKLNKMLTSKP